MASKSRTSGKPYIPAEWETVSCPFCGSDDFTYYEHFGDHAQYTYVKCDRCTLVVQNPRPKYDQRFIDEAYSEYGNEEDHIKEMDPSLPSVQRVISGWKIEVADLSRFAGNQGPLLDVGCKAGEYILAAKERFPKAEGIEISKSLADIAARFTGCKIHFSRYEDFRPVEKYSVIRMSHVLEHIPNPVEWMKHSRDLLLPGGILMVCVPNMFSMDRLGKLFLKRLRLRRGKWPPWKTPDHLFEPTVKSMTRLLESTGYRILDIHTYSRKTMVPGGPIANLLNRRLFLGTNLRIYAQLA